MQRHTIIKLFSVLAMNPWNVLKTWQMVWWVVCEKIWKMFLFWTKILPVWFPPCACSLFTLCLILIFNGIIFLLLSISVHNNLLVLLKYSKYFVGFWVNWNFQLAINYILILSVSRKIHQYYFLETEIWQKLK